MQVSENEKEIIMKMKAVIDDKKLKFLFISRNLLSFVKTVKFAI